MAERVEQPTGHTHRVVNPPPRIPARFVAHRETEFVEDRIIHDELVPAHIVVTERWSDGAVTTRVMGDRERAAYLAGGGS